MPLDHEKIKKGKKLNNAYVAYGSCKGSQYAFKKILKANLIGLEECGIKSFIYRLFLKQYPPRPLIGPDFFLYETEKRL